jgi:DNA (cytosine-5)-methyltransferase 1
MSDYMEAIRLRLANGSKYRATLEEAVALSCTDGGALNPAWVEWLMGYPAGWTDCGG